MPYCTAHHMGRTESREPLATRTDENGFSRVATEAAFFTQLLQRWREIGCKRNQAFFSAFPTQQHVGRPIQPQISDIDANRLRHTSAGAS
jgi:hypothetical protein